ncbi:MAG: sel1 repeat family protein [Rhodobiaceae bacterium]|nr:sel1 repeat family protein [Rhodobiaceae bacterium]
MVTLATNKNNKEHAMTRYFRLLAILLCLSLAPLSSAFADAEEDFDRGWAAYTKGDYPQAVKWFRKAAEQGNAFAQFNLGVMYAKGEGVPQNDAQALKWYRKATEQGYAGAQYNLGFMYDKGLGVRQDDAEAVKWYRKAAEQGYAGAQNNLGYMYGLGLGVRQDYVTALMWVNLAAAQGQELAIGIRDIAAKHLTPQQISKAQTLAAACKQRKYKGC